MIEAISPQATRDLRELWTRIAFSILVSNTDDHLRNHGFLRTVTAGWELAPAFDINPNPEAGPGNFATPIDGESERSIELLLDVAEYFRITRDDGLAILAAVHETTSQWDVVAQSFGLTKEAVAAMTPAFVHEQSATVEALLS